MVKPSGMRLEDDGLAAVSGVRDQQSEIRYQVSDRISNQRVFDLITDL
jgi:hypothetical protein